MMENASRALVSIIVVNYNGERFLEKAFTSLRQQTYQPCEVIFVDSGSKDNSVAFTRTHFPEVQVIASSNRGFGAACNLGAHHAKGSYILFLNEDIHVPPTYVEELFNAYGAIHQRDKRIGALTSSHDTYDGTRKPDIRPGKIDPFGYPAPVRGSEEYAALIPGCPFFMSRQLFLKSGGFCENIFLYNEDTDLSWRLALMGYHQYSAPHVRLYHWDAASLPGFPPQKIYYFVYSTLVCIFNNYSIVFLSFFLILNLLYTVFAIQLGLLIFSKGNIEYSRAIFSGIFDFFRKASGMIPFRRRVQQMRVISDIEFISRYMHFRPSLLVARSYRKL